MIIIGFFVAVLLLAYNLTAALAVTIPLAVLTSDNSGSVPGSAFLALLGGIFAFVVEWQIYVWIKPWLMLTFPDYNWS